MGNHAPGKRRTCKFCGTSGIEGEEFYLGQGNVCKPCARGIRERHRLEVQAEAGDRHDRRKEQMRIAQAKRLYGLTAEEARALYSQELCDICSRPAMAAGGKRLNIDHCHHLKVVRGVLCNRCNRGLGFFLDDADLLEAAARYIRNPPNPNIKEHSAVRDRPASLGPVPHGAESD